MPGAGASQPCIRAAGSAITAGIVLLAAAHPVFCEREWVYAAVVACLAFLAARCLVQRRRRDEPALPWFPPAGLVAPAALLALGIAISCVLGPSTRVQDLGKPASHLFLLWLGWWLAGDDRVRDRLAFAAVGAAAAAGAYGLMQFAGLDPLPAYEAFSGRVLASFENPNHFADFAAAALILALGGFLSTALRPGDHARPLRSLAGWYLAVGLIYAGLLLAASRGGWWSYLCGLAVLVGGLALGLRRGWARWRWRPVLAMAVLLGSITAVLSGAPVMPGPAGPMTLTDRVVSSAAIVEISGPGDSTLNHRYFLWQVAWEMIRQHPLAGVGYGAFERQYPGVRAQLGQTARFAALDPGQRQEVPHHAHNEYLHLWAESGVLALLGLSLLLAMGMRSGLGDLCRSSDMALPRWSAVAAVTTFIVHGAVSYPLHMPLNALLLWLLLGIIFRAHRRGQTADSTS